MKKRWLIVSLLLSCCLNFSDIRADQTNAETQNSGTYLTLFREPNQGAFTLLIPKGWKAEGGVGPSGAEWNSVDLVETNLKFRVTSPDGKSFFGWYPKFNFQDPATTNQSSMGMLQIQPGQVLNGCWQYPYMNITQYAQFIVLGQFGRDEFINPRILGPAAPSPELQPFIPKEATRSEAGYVNFESTIRGVPSYGRIYAILYDLQGVIWSSAGTFGLTAPKERWAQDERLMEYCIRSFRIDPAWFKAASAASAQRAEKYGRTLADLQRMDAEIAGMGAQTRSDSMTEFYKVLTDQIETRDPESGKEKWLPAYKKAYTDGAGNYFLSDESGPLPVDNDPTWKKLDIINRNAE